MLEEYARDNWAVVALVDLAADLEWKDSWLYHYRIWRNRATHQFLRVDPARTEPNVTGGLIDMSFEELSAGALQALQLARSTILSLFQAVALSIYADRSPNTAE